MTGFLSRANQRSRAPNCHSPRGAEWFWQFDSHLWSMSNFEAARKTYLHPHLLWIGRRSKEGTKPHAADRYPLLSLVFNRIEYHLDIRRYMRVWRNMQAIEGFEDVLISQFTI